MKMLWFISTISFIIYYGFAQKSDDSLFFDLNAPDIETFLTPSDFAAMESMDFSKIDNNTENWYTDAMYNPEFFEGDIANDLNASTVMLFLNGGPIVGQKDDIHLNAIRDRRQLWKNARIPYALSSQYSEHSRAIIASAMQEYSKHTCIQWEPRTQYDNDYIYILPERGCYSMVGRTGGRQILSLGQGCIQKGIIMHEMLHAAGFFHEQSRPDRDNYVQILWANIQPGMQGQFEKYSPATVQTFETQYDYASILHYDSVAFSRNGQPTILPKTNTQIGQRGGFSPNDIYKITRLYECTPQNRQISTTTSRPVTIFSKTTTRSPQTTIATYRKLPNSIKCINKRPDCDQLFKAGWCQKNEPYMNEHCCGICKNEGKKVETKGSCEDLRVDCLSLVKRRYCIMSPKFTKLYCSKSCGYCDDKEIIDGAEITTLSSLIRTISPQIITTQSTTITTTSQPTTTIQLCRDKNYKCVTWKKYGYCKNPIYYNYMKQTCPFSCKHCTVYNTDQ